MTQPLEQDECAVLIVGAGPTGLLLACLLARRGVEVRVLERRAAPASSSRAIGLHPPALRVLAALGLDRVAADRGERVRIGRARARGGELGEVDFARTGRRPPFVLTLPQSRTEQLLAADLAQHAPAALRRGWEVTGLQDAGSSATVTARRSGGAGVLRVRADLLVGADGSRSRIRALLGIDGSGRDYPDAYLMGDFGDPAAQHEADTEREEGATGAEGAEGATGGEREAVIHLEPGGVIESFPLPGGGRRWVVHTGADGADPSLAGLVSLVRQRTGIVVDAGTCSMLSAFTVRRRTARRLLAGRCVLLGDAAHEVSPIGGQGITLGWLDALEIAPLLARHVTEKRAGALRADSDWCRAERRIRRRARRAGMIAGANTALGRPAGPRTTALRELAVRSLLRTPLRHGLAWVYSMGWTSPGRWAR